MGQPNNPFDGKRILRAQLGVAALAVFGVALFGLMWVILGEMGVADAPRVFGSFCVPPAIISLLMGLYLLLRRSDENAH